MIVRLNFWGWLFYGMKINRMIGLLILTWAGRTAAQSTLSEFDRAIMRVPPAPLKWETNLTSLTVLAEKGDTNAELDLGLHYVFAVGTTQKLDKALQWLTKSASRGFPPAEYTLGLMYKCGVGVVSNQVVADAWFKKSADQGHTPSKHEMALAADRDGKRMEAVKLLREAAENGFPPSQYLMGCVASDVVEKYVWYSLAARNIEIAGTRSLEVRPTLTNEQLTEAEERIRKYQAKQASHQHRSP
jgi:hypothetical protein